MTEEQLRLELARLVLSTKPQLTNEETKEVLGQLVDFVKSRN